MCSCCDCKGQHSFEDRDERVLRTLEEIERLNEERQKGLIYVDRIARHGGCITIRFCMGLDAVR